MTGISRSSDSLFICSFTSCLFQYDSSQVLSWGFPGGSADKQLACNAGDFCGFSPWVRKIPRRKGMATHSSLPAWRIPSTEKPGGLRPQGHKELDTTEVSEHTHMHTSSTLQSLPPCSAKYLIFTGRQEHSQFVVAVYF